MYYTDHAIIIESIILTIGLQDSFYLSMQICAVQSGCDIEKILVAVLFVTKHVIKA